MRAKGVADYLLVTDINAAPCISAKKQAIQARFKNAETERIFVVRMEIESWYFAGLDDEACKELKVTFAGETNELTKEGAMAAAAAGMSGSRIDFLIEVLKRFSLHAARPRNSSLDYFVRSLLPE